MARATSVLALVGLSATLLLLGLVSGKKMTAVGYDVGRPVETACFEGDISFQDNTNEMYVGVPTALFELPGGKNTCGQKIKVSCVGPFGNEKGNPCKNSKPVTLTIIDTLTGPSIEISNKAFNIISDFDVGRLTVNVD